MSIWQKEKVYYVDTVAGMLALTGVKDGTRVDTARYSTSHTVGDGSGGEYVYHATGRSGITADGGFFHNGPGADDYWELKDQSKLNTAKFGVLTNGSDQHTVLQAMLDKASAAQKPVQWVGQITCNSDLVFKTNCHIVGVPGSGKSFQSRLQLTGDARVVFDGDDGIGTNWSFQNSIRDLRIVTSARTARSITADNTTETFTLTSHGFTNNTLVRFGGTTLPTGLTANTEYFVVNATANTFQVSAKPSGSVVAITSDGTAVTVTLSETIRIGQAYWIELNNVVGFDIPHCFVNITGGNHTVLDKITIDGTGNTSGAAISLAGGSVQLINPSVQQKAIGLWFTGGQNSVTGLYCEACLHGIRLANGESQDVYNPSGLSLQGGLMRQINAGLAIAVYNSSNVSIPALTIERDEGDTYCSYVYATATKDVVLSGIDKTYFTNLDGVTPSGNVHLVILRDRFSRKHLADDLGNLGATATINFDAATGDGKYGTLTASTAITFSGTRPGEYWVKLTQNGTGGHNPTFPNIVNSPPTITATANAETLLRVLRDELGQFWCTAF